MDQHLRELKRRIDTSPRSTTGKRLYTRELKREVADVVRRRSSDGVKKVELARALGVSESLIWKWVSRYKTEHPKVREVELEMENEVQPVLEGESPGTQNNAWVVLPSGAVIENLDLQSLIAVARALS